MLKNLLSKGGCFSKNFLNSQKQLGSFPLNKRKLGSTKEHNYISGSNRRKIVPWETSTTRRCRILSSLPIYRGYQRIMTTFKGEKPLEPETKKFLTCMSPYPLCIQDIDHQKEKYMKGMTKEDINANEKKTKNIMTTLNICSRQASGQSTTLFFNNS